MEKFAERLNFLISEISSGNVTEFANKSGIKQATLYNYTKGRAPNAESLNNICSIFGVNLNWLVSGKGTPYIEEEDSTSFETQPPPTPNNLTENQHMELVRMFYDKPRANSAVMDLLEIERLNRESFIEVVGLIKGVAINLKVGSDHKSYTDLERRKAQRRVANNNGDMPGGIERRSGKDRRKAVGGDR